MTSTEMETTKLLGLINQVLENSGKAQLTTLTDGMHLRNDLGMDSFQLAELTVRIEDETGIDIFQDGIVDTIADIKSRLNAS